MSTMKKKKKEQELPLIIKPKNDTIEINEKDSEGIGFWVIEKALSNPMTKVNRTKFLTDVLKDKVTSDVLEKAIKYGTAEAGIPLEIIRESAKKCISSTKKISTAESAATGALGGPVGIPTGILADITQFYGNLIILIQKLVYLYGMKDINSIDEIRDNNEELISMLATNSSNYEYICGYIATLSELEDVENFGIISEEQVTEVIDKALEVAAAIMENDDIMGELLYADILNVTNIPDDGTANFFLQLMNNVNDALKAPLYFRELLFRILHKCEPRQQHLLFRKNSVK